MTRMVTALRTLGIEPTIASQLDEFIALFLKWNAGINLSAARTRAEIVDHVIDSLQVIPHIRSAHRVLDVGSGGGFPVVIAALCLPHVQFVALEPVHKKHAFLRTVARELSLQNLESLAERLEHHVVHDYDATTSRATFDLAEWLTVGATHVRPGGVVIGFEAIPRLDLENIERHPYPAGDKTRAIVIRRFT